MALNAAFSVNSSSAIQAHAVSYNGTVTLAALSTSFRTIAWEIVSGSKSGTTTPSISLSGTPTGATATFSQVADPGDGLGRSWLVKCTQTDSRGNAAVAYRLVGTANDRGRVPVAASEETARNATHGWVEVFNEALNDSGSGSGGSGVGGAPNARVRVLGAGIPTGGSNDSHSGLAARDGVTLVDGDIVLDVWHSTSALRGYWVAHSGAWTRPAYYDADADVAALFGTYTTIQEGTTGALQAWRQVGGYTLAGGKLYEQILGNPDIVEGENGSRTELGTDEGSGTGRLYNGARFLKDLTATIAAGATATIWTFDGAALGLLATDKVLHAPNVIADWATDDKWGWFVRAAAVKHATPPVITAKKAQEAIGDVATSTGTDYLTLDWDLSGNVLRLRATNNRASTCTVVVDNVFLAAQVRP